MKAPTLPMEGQCRCGKVRVRIDAPPLLTAACHCTGCQRMSSSAYSLTVSVPSTGFHVTQGEPVIGALHGETRHYFCGWCMTWMFTRPKGDAPFVNLRPTMLEDVSWFEPWFDAFLSEKLPWVQPVGRRSFEGFPEMSEFPVLMREYAEAIAR